MRGGKGSRWWAQGEAEIPRPPNALNERCIFWSCQVSAGPGTMPVWAGPFGGLAMSGVAAWAKRGADLFWKVYPSLPRAEAGEGR